MLQKRLWATSTDTVQIPLLSAELTPAGETFSLIAEQSSFNEGSSDLFTLTTTGVAPGTIFNYALTGLPAADFANGQSTGSVTIDAEGVAYISVSVLPNVLSASAALTLTVASISDVVTVNDTSAPSQGTYILTTGADQIVTPSTGTYTVIGALGQLTTAGREALGTFSVGDSITGDGANTTLIINQNKINTSDPNQEYDLVPIGVQISNVGTIVIDSVQALGAAGTFFDLTDNAANNTSFNGVNQVNVSNSSGNDFVSVSGTTSLNLIDTAGNVTTEGGANVSIETFDTGNGKSASVNVGGGPNGAPKGAILVRDYGTGSVTTSGGTNVTVHLGSGAANGGVLISGETGNVEVDGGSTTTPLAGTATVYGGSTDTVNANGAVIIDSRAAGAAPGQTGVSVTEYGINAPITIGTLGAGALSADPTRNVVVTDLSASGSYNAGAVTVDTNGATFVQVAGGTAGGITDYQSTVEGGVSSLATVTLVGVAGTEVITSNALTTLNADSTWLNKAGRTAIVVNSAVSQALALSMHGDTGLQLTDNSASAVNINVGGLNPGLVLSASNAQSLSITGTTVLSLQGSANLGNVRTLTISGGAGFTDAGLKSVTSANPLANYQSLSTINGAASTNQITASINAHQSFVGGSGADTVTISADQLARVFLGSGTSNTLVVNAPGAGFTKANTGTNVSGFSKLETTASASGTYDLANVFHSVGTVEVTKAPAGSLVFSNAGVNQTLAIDASMGNMTVALSLPQNVSGQLLTLDLGTTSSSGIDTTNGPGGGVLGTQQLAANLYYNATVDSIGAAGSTGTNTTLLNDNALGLRGGTLTVNGNESLNIGTTLAAGTGNIGIINVNSSAGATVNLTHLGTTSNGVSLTAGDASVIFDGYAGSIKTDTITAGSGNNILTEKGAGGLIVAAQNGNNTISSVGGVLDVTLGNGNNSVIGNGATASITEGNGSDSVSVGTGRPSLSETVTLGSGNNDIVTVGSVGGNAVDLITLGNGYNDQVTGGNGPMEVSLGNGNNDAVSLGGGPDTITIGNGNDKVAVGNGNNTITAGSGTDQIVLGTGNNSIAVNLGAGSAGGVTVSFSAASSAANSITLGNGHNTILGASLAQGNNTITVGNGANTIGVGGGHNIITAGNGANSITVGNGVNDISVGSGSNSITLGSGYNNVVNLAAHTLATDKIAFATRSTGGIDQFSGLAHGDSLAFQADGNEVWNGGSAASAQVIEPPNATFQDYLNAACFGTNASNGVFSWFEFNSNTYVVEDRSTASTFVAGSDLVLELSGKQSSLILGSALNGTTHTLTF